jgi:magnesium transporter
VESHMTVREILKTIRHETTDFASLSAIYVLNREQQLVGVFNPHELMMQDFTTPAYKFMVPEPVVVLLTTPIEVVGHKLIKYRLSALPVINREKKIIGIITMDDIAGRLQRKLI